MEIEIKVPLLPESESSAQISLINVAEGHQVSANQILFEVETDKVVLEVIAPTSGIIDDFRIAQGQSVVSEEVAMTLQVDSDTEETNQEEMANSYTQTSETSTFTKKPEPESQFGAFIVLFGAIIIAIGVFYLFRYIQ